VRIIIVSTHNRLTQHITSDYNSDLSLPTFLSSQKLGQNYFCNNYITVIAKISIGNLSYDFTVVSEMIRA